mmetsp:Transcript_47509/g.55497  ORF Transcript_47509/g.55497 Transcript_47509/m.55497 type:complete len:329 (+) Transcript_47509:164-1150(+)
MMRTNLIISRVKIKNAILRQDECSLSFLSSRFLHYNNLFIRSHTSTRLIHFMRERQVTNNRTFSSVSSKQKEANDRIRWYLLSAVIGAIGATYASVPLYKMFCQATGFGGTTQRITLEEWAEREEKKENASKSSISDKLMDKLYSLSNVPGIRNRGGGHGVKTWTDDEAAARLASLKPVKDGRLIRVYFDSTIGDVLPWSFTPAQRSIRIVPGETALCFFTVTNHSEKAITGVATYNVFPPKAGLYFNKIQCFCFEEQRLLPGETVDMPVFFFIDPDYADDGHLTRCNNITLSYTFFQTDEDDGDEDDEDDEDDEEEVEEDGKVAIKL